MVYAEEIEGAVLGACLLERSAQAVVLKSLRAEMFYLTAHRVVFEAINALYARGAAVDMLTVTEELRALGRWTMRAVRLPWRNWRRGWLRRLTWSIIAASCFSITCGGSWWRR